MTKGKAVPRWKFEVVVITLLVIILAILIRVYKVTFDTHEILSPVATQTITIIRQETVDNMISEAAVEYGVPRYVLHCVIFHESNRGIGQYDQNAVGDNGKAMGFAQFWLNTWKGFQRLRNRPTTISRTNPRESIDALAWAIANGRGTHNWTPISDGRCPLSY